jgi:hypothetical protein
MDKLRAAVLQERMGQGRAALENSPEGADRILGEREQYNLSPLNPDVEPRAGGDPKRVADLAGEHHLALGRGFYDCHNRLPFLIS